MLFSPTVAFPGTYTTNACSVSLAVDGYLLLLLYRGGVGGGTQLLLLVKQRTTLP